MPHICSLGTLFLNALNALFPRESCFCVLSHHEMLTIYGSCPLTTGLTDFVWGRSRHHNKTAPRYTARTLAIFCAPRVWPTCLPFLNKLSPHRAIPARQAKLRLPSGEIRITGPLLAGGDHPRYSDLAIDDASPTRILDRTWRASGYQPGKSQRDDFAKG
jgi:hypothetical protein